MRTAVRLARRTDGGFRIEGVAATSIDGVPDAGGFVLTGSGSLALAWNEAERGWILTSSPGESERELGRTTTVNHEPVLAPVSVLLEDGRLFRLAMFGASDPRIEVGRWDLPGAYLVGRATGAGWELELTAAGTALEAPIALWILTCVEIGRLDGWY